MRTFYSRIKQITNTLFTKHLFLTNTTVGVIFVGAGDVIQQNIEKKLYYKDRYEVKRTGNMMIAGSAFGGLGHLWYSFLDKKFPGTTVKNVGKKLLSEMAIAPPLMLVFFLGIGFLEGKQVKTSIDDFKKNFITILIADWLIYVPLQSLNFFFLPPKYRVLYVCILSLAYDVFLSYIVHKEDNEKLMQKMEN